MSASNLPSPHRFNRLTVTIHWLTVLLFICVYVSMEFRDIFERGTPGRDLMKTSHYWFGICILLLLAIRLFARFKQPTPVINPPQPHWQQLLAKGVHLAIYTLMLVMPVLGLLLLSADAVPLRFFGTELPALIATDAATAEWLEDLHEIGATVGYYLIGIHALAALFHHYWLKDNTLVRMSFKK
ncbi:cytochrome b [Rheinheimera riviphila]|uniref:Cytochrome b n=1 Tax=Rheinheimera riviphila TaxID=1834037 RepID=A0A437QS57_9GAMM|nr:cytochrome b [Rheinheimera riviphila]RVU37345.1 cytochrome b [Rheinheimera riviphila]